MTDTVLGTASTVLMSLAALGTSWSSYQSSMWTDRQLAIAAAASALRLRATNFELRAAQTRTVDVGLFSSWLDAYMNGNQRLAHLRRHWLGPGCGAKCS